MSFKLSDVVPWGRNFDEYVAMFALSDEDLAKRILGCGDGPAAFNAIATKKGCHVTSVDPLYQFSLAEIDKRIQETAMAVTEQTRINAREFVWTHFKTVDDLIAARMGAMSMFLADYPKGLAEGRYLNASVPSLPLEGNTFQLALCSHFLFLYSEQHDAAFHVQSILELMRVASEVRVFPLLELGARPSRHIETVMKALNEHGMVAMREPVHYEFQKGGNEMLRIITTSTQEAVPVLSMKPIRT
jgi:hypothetical protein